MELCLYRNNMFFNKSGNFVFDAGSYMTGGVYTADGGYMIAG